MEIENRVYKTKDVDMLSTVATIVESAIAKKEFLLKKRSIWADPFFDNLKKRIEAATRNYLGVDSARDLRNATQRLTLIQGKALKDLSEGKVQISEDFKDDKGRRDELLKQLGFTAFLGSARRKDQESLVQLLYQFKTNLTPALKEEITAKGTDKEILDAITGYADDLYNANITQETVKGLRKEISNEAVQEFNGIYNAVISICKISAKFYREQPAVKDQFSFSRVNKALNNFKPAAKKDPKI